MKKNEIICYDICCGAGGMSLGFHKGGAAILGGIDRLDYPIQTISSQFPKGSWTQKTMEELIENLNSNNQDIQNINEANTLLCGLPCQGFSTAGKRNVNDDRNYLFKSLLKIVKIVNPEFIVVENVVGLLHKNNQKIYNSIVNGFKRLKYNVESVVLNAANFDVPQIRNRLFIIASKSVNPKNIIKNITKSKNIKNVRTAFKGLSNTDENEDINHTFMKHGKKVVDKIRNMNGNIHLSYRRLSWDKPASTVIVGHNALPVHPEAHRAISVREAARLQGFPDSHIFKGSRTSQSEQIANAVPPPLAKAICKAMFKTINENGCIN